MSSSTPTFDVRCACALAIAAALVSASRLASAAEPLDGPSATAPATDDGTQLQEIVVTSTRQAEPLSKVPISVEVFTEKQMHPNGKIVGVRVAFEGAGEMRYAKMNGEVIE